MKQLEKLTLLILTLFSLFLGGCSGKVFSKVYHVGVDPTFFPVELTGQTVNVFAFMNELFQEISKDRGVEIVRINLSWDNLLLGLKLGKCEGVISSLPPNLVNLTKYTFSDAVLRTGPVLVVPKQNKGTSLSDLSGQVVMIEKSDSELELMSRYPTIEALFYDRTVEALESVSKGRVAGSLVPVLQAYAYTKDVFQKSVAISSHVLTNEALRLVTLKGEQKELHEIFNEGLTSLMDSGAYQELLTKWNLFQP